MKILVACEESQEVCKAFRSLGHEAYSCDIQDCSGGHPEWHKKQDVIPLLYRQWDLIIAFPPCTDLAVSGARWFDEKRRDGRQQRSIEFFMEFVKAPCKHIAIENPIGIMSSVYRKPDQIIQPYQFGHPVSKRTCLWLKGLPLLYPTNVVRPGKTDKYGFTEGAPLQMARDENGKIISWNDPRTAKLRSKTFPGIARAMAEQWSEYLKEE